MKVLLQHKMTQFYLSQQDKWTADPDFATDFHTSLHAIDFIRHFNLEQTDIVLKFPDPKYDIILQHMPHQQARPQERRMY
jgi:hypothetical protein